MKSKSSKADGDLVFRFLREGFVMMIDIIVGSITCYSFSKNDDRGDDGAGNHP